MTKLVAQEKRTHSWQFGSAQLILRVCPNERVTLNGVGRYIEMKQQILTLYVHSDGLLISSLAVVSCAGVLSARLSRYLIVCDCFPFQRLLLVRVLLLQHIGSVLKKPEAFLSQRSD